MKHVCVELEAMKAVAVAARAKSLDAFKAAIELHSSTLTGDELISHHMDKLYESMFESNLLKIIYPYSAVEVSHVAKLINLPEDIVCSITLF